MSHLTAFTANEDIGQECWNVTFYGKSRIHFKPQQRQTMIVHLVASWTITYCIWSLTALPLQNIRKRTAEGDEQHSSLSSIIKAVELSISKWTTLIWNKWDSCILCFEIQTPALVKPITRYSTFFLDVFTEELEGKVKSVANYERLQELQSSLVWPSITELDPKAFIPEVSNPLNEVLFSKLTFNSWCVANQEATIIVKNTQELARRMKKANRELRSINVFPVFSSLQFLRGILAKQPCESLLASPKRQLLYEGPLMLHGNSSKILYFAYTKLPIAWKVFKQLGHL